MKNTSAIPNNGLSTSDEQFSPAFLKHFEGYTNKEIAQQLQLPITVVRASIRKSRRLIRISFRHFLRKFKHSPYSASHLKNMK